MANIIYIVVLVLVIGYGFYTQRRTSKMLQAVLKPTQTDEVRWTITERQALQRPTAEELRLAQARLEWDRRIAEKQG